MVAKRLAGGNRAAVCGSVGRDVSGVEDRVGAQRVGLPVVIAEGVQSLASEEQPATTSPAS
jgi:hypothetical protein